MVNTQIRQTAYKVWISQIVSSEFVVTNDEWSPNYFLLGNKKVSRVNIIANVVLKYESQNSEYINLTIDDGSSNIRIKAWKDDARVLRSINIGDLALLIGRIRKFNDEIYISPEIVKKLDNLDFARLRIIELKRLYGEDILKVPREESSVVQEDSKMYEEELIEFGSPLNKRQKILSLIESMDSEKGVDVFDIINSSKMALSEAQSILSELIRDGEVFEISSNKIKLVK